MKYNIMKLKSTVGLTKHLVEDYKAIRITETDLPEEIMQDGTVLCCVLYNGPYELAVKIDSNEELALVKEDFHHKEWLLINPRIP